MKVHKTFTASVKKHTLECITNAIYVNQVQFFIEKNDCHIYGVETNYENKMAESVSVILAPNNPKQNHLYRFTFSFASSVYYHQFFLNKTDYSDFKTLQELRKGVEFEGVADGW